MASFNLVDQCWLPCEMPDGSVRDLGLAETLARARDIRSIVDPSPLVTAALYRLLLAILHRVVGPKTIGEWERLWKAGTFPADVLAYLDCWRSRFDLFSAEHPFYQTAGLGERYCVSVSCLRQELASGEAIALLNHDAVKESLALDCPTAARHLIAHQAFALGGLVSRDAPEHKSANAAPLAKGAIVLVRGRSLFETLLLNLHRYNPEVNDPFECEEDDCPAWERNEPTQPEDRYPLGYLDLLTWQSRRIRLFPDLESDGSLCVRRVVIMKGYQFPDGFTLSGRETMLSFSKRRNPEPGQDPFPPLAFREDRALWRDSLALFQSVAGQRYRPKILDWLNELASEEAGQIISRSTIIPLDLLGMSSDQKKVMF